MKQKIERCNLYRVMKPKNLRAACAALNKLICPWDQGFSTATKKCTRPRGHADYVIRTKNALGYFPTMWRNCLFHEHFEGRATFFYTSSGHGKSPVLMLMLDPDYHGEPDPEEAERFLRWLDLPGSLYTEASTSGSSRHGYLFVEVSYLGIQFVVDHLDRWCTAKFGEWKRLHPESKMTGFEIRGTPPRIDWGQPPLPN